MRFDRRSRPEDYRWTARKEVFHVRRQQRDMEKIARAYPLFTDQFVPPPVLPVEEEKTLRERMMLASDQRMRDLLARQWRSARGAYFACSAEVRSRIREKWTRWPD